MQKRGLSAVVTTVIMVLLVMVAVGIVWVVVKNLITDSTSQISGDFKIDLEILTITKDTTSGDGLNVQIRRNVGAGTVEKVTFLVYDGTTAVTIEKTIAAGFDELELLTITLSNGEITAGLNPVTEISIYPMAKLDNGEFRLYQIPTDKTIGSWVN